MEKELYFKIIELLDQDQTYAEASGYASAVLYAEAIAIIKKAAAEGILDLW